MNKTKKLTTEEYGSKHPILSREQYIKSHIKKYENDEDYTENATITKQERAIYYTEIGKSYMEYRKPQPTYPQFSWQNLLTLGRSTNLF